MAKSHLDDDYVNMEHGENALDEPLVATVSSKKIYRNFLFFAACFALNHACVTTVISIATTVNHDKNLGSVSLGVLYIVYVLVAALLSHAVTHKLGPKMTLVFGLSSYCCYIVAYLVAVLIPAIKWPVVLIGAAIGGAAAGFLWPAQGSYFGTTAKAYAAATASEAGVETVTVKAANAKFANIFALVYLGCEMLLKIAVSTLQHVAGSKSWAHVALFVVLTSVAVASSFGITLVFDTTRLQNAEERRAAAAARAAPIPFGKKLLSALSLMLTDAKCALMLPINATFGFAAAYLNSYVAADIVSAAGGIGGDNVAFLAAILVATAAAVNPLFARFGKTTSGKVGMVALGALCFAVFVLAFAVQSRADQIHTIGSSWSALVLLYMLYGAGRGAWEGVFKAFVADVFPDAKEAAFANVQLQSGLASTIGFFLFPVLDRMPDGMTVLAVIAVSCAGLAILAQPLTYAIFSLETKLNKASAAAAGTAGDDGGAEATVDGKKNNGAGEGGAAGVELSLGDAEKK